MKDQLARDGLWSFYQKLQDEESRELFMCRYETYHDHEWDRLLQLPDIAKRYSEKKGPPVLPKANHLGGFALWEDVVIFGGGLSWPGVFTAVKSLGYNTVAVIDNQVKPLVHIASRLAATQPPERLMDRYAGIKIVISSPKYEAEIYRQLLVMGIDKRLIYTVSYPDDRRVEQDYFAFSFFQPVEKEVYLDVGCYDTDTIDAFIRFCGGRYEKILGMEPDERQFAKIEEVIHNGGYSNVHIERKGAWNEDTILSFSDGDAMLAADSDGGIALPVARIDGLVGGNRVTMIKMDIEGAELAALQGAAETLQRDKPRLAVCIYHKPDDIVQIPFLLDSLVPNYQYYIRHMHYWVGDTVLFAVPA